MSARKKAATVRAEQASRLSLLRIDYEYAKAELDAAKERMDTITAGIKAELAAQVDDPAVTVIDLVAADKPPLRMSYVEQWRLDAKRMKSEAPELYVRYAKQSGYWQLKAVTS